MSQIDKSAEDTWLMNNKLILNEDFLSDFRKNTIETSKNYSLKQ